MDEPKKRRGRPPKNKPAETPVKPTTPDSPDTTSPVYPAPAAKKRGRPAASNTLEVKPSTTKVYGFNLLDRGPKMNEAVQEVLARGEKQARLVVGDPNKPKLLVPVLPFQMQAALQSKGLMAGTIVEIFGPEAVGKSTLTYTTIGWGMQFNCPAAVFSSEAKPMFQDRIMQCLHWDKNIAKAMYDSLYQREVHDIKSMVKEAESWLMQIRDTKNPATYVPLSIPAIIAVDSWSKLMDPGEANSYAAYGGPSTMAPKKDTKPNKEKSDNAKAREIKEAKKQAAKIKEIGEVSNLGSAQMAAAWCRRLPSLLSSWNAIIIVVRHQTTRIYMQSKPGGSFLSEEDKAPFNNNSRGGRSFPQSAAYELILTPGKKIKRVIGGQDVVVGQDIYVNINKNSFGPSFGKFSSRINMAAMRDNDVFQDMALDFSETLPEVLKAAGLDVVRYADNDFSCKSLGVDRATAAEFQSAFYQNGDAVDNTARRLKIKGYGDELCKWPTMNPAFAPKTEETPVQEPEVPTGLPDSVVEEPLVENPPSPMEDGGGLIADPEITDGGEP